jgi:tetratricopeptide (TPR) repeat protein
MSKPMVITLPLIMILLDYWPLRRFESPSGKVNPVLWQLKEKLPFCVLLMGLVIVTLYTPNKQDSPPIKDFSFISQLTNAPVSFVTYLGKTFWPHDLAVFYPFPDQIPAWQVWGATILIIIITVFVIVTAKRLPYLFVGWFWFAVSIFPVMGIMRIGDFAMADRYHYLPSIGLAVMLAWGIPLLFQRETARKRILFPATIAFLAFLTFLTWKQCDYWKNNEKIWNHALNVTKDNYLAHINLGSALFEKGENDKAIYHYNKALLIIKISKVYYSLGIVYSSIGKYQQAIESYNQAIRMIPNFAAAHYNLGIIYCNFGNYQQAVKNFSQAVHAAPDLTAAYYNLGVAYHLLGQNQRALENYSEAIRLKHDYGNAYNSRALVYLNTGDSVSGCRDAKKACELGNCATMQAVAGKGLCR